MSQPKDTKLPKDLLDKPEDFCRCNRDVGFCEAASAYANVYNFQRHEESQRLWQAGIEGHEKGRAMLALLEMQRIQKENSADGGCPACGHKVVALGADCDTDECACRCSFYMVPPVTEQSESVSPSVEDTIHKSAQGDSEPNAAGNGAALAQAGVENRESPGRDFKWAVEVLENVAAFAEGEYRKHFAYDRSFDSSVQSDIDKWNEALALLRTFQAKDEPELYGGTECILECIQTAPGHGVECPRR